jgi:hypothetical protein
MYESDMFTQEDFLNNEKKVLTSIKKEKKNVHTITKVVNAEIRGKFYKTVDISYYGTSNMCGKPIVHAITGETTKFRVGTRKDEDQMFKVVVSTGSNPNGPIHLFYNSPQEYETHQFVTLDAETKNAWAQKLSSSA